MAPCSSSSVDSRTSARTTSPQLTSRATRSGERDSICRRAAATCSLTFRTLASLVRLRVLVAPSGIGDAPRRYHGGIRRVDAGRGVRHTPLVRGISVLGPLQLDGNGAVVGRRDRVVLAALSLEPGEPVSAERLADALWPEGMPASWNKVVQGCVVRLRKTLGAGAIDTLPHGYRLTLPADEVDALRFERLLRRGRELMTLGEPERAAHVLGEALALWRGRALLDLEGWEPGR